MPEKYKEITIKIVSSPYISGNDAYCDVIMWGNPQKWTFRMKLGKTLWFSIYKYLQEMDNSRFSEELEPSVLQENLKFLNGRIITIRAISDQSISFKTKDGKVEYGKKFVADFRSDLEEAEAMGGEFYKKAFFDTVLDNVMGKDCIVANSDLAKAGIEKVKEKEMKREEKKKKDWGESEVEWVVRKREEDKKNEKELKRLDVAGW
jgi:hypothetical protein